MEHTCTKKSNISSMFIQQASSLSLEANFQMSDYTVVSLREVGYWIG